ncbi:MAG: hypothetical protein ACKOB0_08710, partial [Chthoniobacterales bacterium]
RTDTVTEKREDKFPQPDYYWGTSEGSREFDRLIDRSMTFRERLQWLEDAETLSLRMAASRVKEEPK